MKATWSVGVEDGDGGAAIPRELGRRTVGPVLQRGWHVKHLPVDLFAKVVHDVLSSGWAQRDVVGPALWLSKLDELGLQENVAIWFQFEGETVAAVP